MYVFFVSSGQMELRDTVARAWKVSIHPIGTTHDVTRGVLSPFLLCGQAVHLS